MHHILDAQDLSYRDGSRLRVDGVSFGLERGEVLGLLGTNGAGKTTTLAMLCGALVPSGGRVYLLGEDLYRGRRDLRGHIGYLPEHAALYPELTVLENLRFAARLRGLRGTGLALAIARVIEQCDLGAIGRRLTRRLSRGEQQRVGLAQAIIHQPDLLILDEPTAGLDPLQAAELRQLLARLAKEQALVLSTHLLQDVEALCQAVVVLHGGRQVHRAAQPGAETSSVRIRLDHPPPLRVLAGLPGVSGADALGDGWFRLTLAPGGDTGIAERLAGQQWGLVACVPAAGDLEAMFSALVTRDNDPAGAAR